MDPVTAGMLLQGVGGIATGIASAIPGKMEKRYRELALQNLNAPNPMAGKVSAANAAAQQRAAAMQSEAIANLGRGSASDTGASGQRQAMAADAQKAAQLGAAQQISQNRQALFDAKVQQRALGQQMLQNAYAMGDARKQRALSAFSGAIGSGGATSQYGSTPGTGISGALESGWLNKSSS